MTDEKKNLSDEQPAPKPVKGPAIWSLVMKDFIDRDIKGEVNYGTRLQADNGRDALIDLYQELLDAVVYTRQEIERRKTRQTEIEKLATTLAKQLLTCPHNCESRKGKQCDCGWTPEYLELRQWATELLGVDFAVAVAGYDVNDLECRTVVENGVPTVEFNHDKLKKLSVAALHREIAGAATAHCPDCNFAHCICYEEDDLMHRLEEVKEKIYAYDVGDKPTSPPASLLLEEENLRRNLQRLRTTGTTMNEVKK